MSEMQHNICFNLRHEHILFSKPVVSGFVRKSLMIPVLCFMCLALMPFRAFAADSIRDSETISVTVSDSDDTRTNAQDSAPVSVTAEPPVLSDSAASPDSDAQPEKEDIAFFYRDIPSPESLGSLFFHEWTRDIIKEYRRSAAMRRTTRLPGPSVRLDGAEDTDDEGVRKGDWPREITVSGIVYTSKDDWVVWLNGQRVTPKGLPDQVHEMKVTGEYVDIKWYDPYTNVVYPVRLRAYERFHLDARIFLPG